MSGSTPRGFAVVPAAGRSVRMGEPKLLLDWRGRKVIEHTLAAWQAGGVAAIVVVVHPQDLDLARLARAAGAQVVVPEQPPPEMKASVQLGLRYIAETLHPESRDAWLLAPADMPALPPRVIHELLQAHRESGRDILIPEYRGRRGHPVLFPWQFADRVPQLAADEGLDALVRNGPTRSIVTDDDRILMDLDTPDDYQRLQCRG